MEFCVKSVKKEFWQRESAYFRDFNYRQLWDYGIASAFRAGAVSEHVGVFAEGCLIGLTDIRIKKIPFLRSGIAYINGGPLVQKGESAADQSLDLCLKAISREYAAGRRLSVRINPLVFAPHLDQDRATVFRKNGFCSVTEGMPYRTIILDITRPLEHIRRQFHQKWRNCLNNSEKQHLTIASGMSLELFEQFSGLYAQLRRRKEFDVDQDDEFFRKVQEKLADPERLYISIAADGGIPVAGHVSSMLGDTCVYLLGASTGPGLKTKAAYLLQWHTIMAAKERGCRWYDLGGIDPENNPGVYHFKKGMGGEESVSPGVFEYHPHRFGRFLIGGCEKVYRAARRCREQLTV